MTSLSRRIAFLFLSAMVAGCSSIDEAKNTVTGWVSASDRLETSKPGIVSSGLKYPATIHVAAYVDQRKVTNPRYLGEMTAQVNGLSGHELLMDQDVAAVATAAVRQRFDAEGFQVGAPDAIFEISGIVKELTLNVKDRDDISIAIETALTEVASGKVVWSALVTEKANRFAGVSGNSKADVMRYLDKELRIVTSKTVDAVSASLMASRPELFNLTPGTHPIPGVTVFVSPPLLKPVVTAPVTVVQRDETASTYRPQAGDKNGLLLVNSNPSRANVYLDGIYYGLSPLRLEIEPGIHAMSVKLTAYKMFVEKVSVRRGDNTEVDVTLEQ